MKHEKRGLSMSTNKQPSLPLLIFGMILTTLGTTAILTELATLSSAQAVTLFCLALGALCLGAILKYRGAAEPVQS